MKLILKIIKWFFGIIFIILSIACFSTTENTTANVLLGLFFLILGLYILIGSYIVNRISILKKIKELDQRLENKQLMYNNELSKIREEVTSQVENELKEKNEALKNIEDVISNKEEVKNNIIQEALRNADIEVEKAIGDRSRLIIEVRELRDESESLTKKITSESKKLDKIRDTYKAYRYSVKKYSELSLDDDYIIPETTLSESELLVPTRILKLHSMDYKELKKLFNENEKSITKKLDEYEKRYTTKANKSIYQLMVLALRAELQNILYNLKYEKLESSINDIKVITGKYMTIAAEGNQSIAPTLVKFIGEIEYLFINAIKIEYEHYLKKEQAKAEQALLREQMREEATERKRLQEEKEKIEKEEAKYAKELDKLNEDIKTTTDQVALDTLKARIKELETQLKDVHNKKEEIINLQNGKAGNVYIISNVGSFGDNMFKIGMTRRLDPMERINELGSASVPFKFDVHSTIFSDDAVDLENKLHQALDKKRVNLVNSRKEFFYSTLDELEELVNQIDPTAEFNKTIIAEEYTQSLHMRETEQDTI